MVWLDEAFADEVDLFEANYVITVSHHLRGITVQLGESKIAVQLKSVKQVIGFQGPNSDCAVKTWRDQNMLLLFALLNRCYSFKVAFENMDFVKATID